MVALTSIVFTFPFEIDQCLFNDDKSLTNKQYVVIDAFDQRQFVKKNTLYLELFLNQGLTEFGHPNITSAHFWTFYHPPMGAHLPYVSINSTERLQKLSFF